MVSDASHLAPNFCLLVESFCFTGLAFSGNRRIIREANNLEDTPLEKCLNICVGLSAFCGIISTYWVSCVDACLYVQQQLEYEKEAVTAGGYRIMEE